MIATKPKLEQEFTYLPEQLLRRAADATVREHFQRLMTCTPSHGRAVHLSDIGYRVARQRLKTLFVTYLHDLRRTLWIALTTIIFGAVVGIIGGSALIVFVKSGTTLIHPYLALFLCLASITLLVHATMSALTMKKQLESTVWRIIQIF